MKHILLVGESPLPHVSGKNRTAYSLRTWHFFQAIVQQGSFLVTVLTLDSEISQKKRKILSLDGAETHIAICKNEKFAVSTLKKLFRTQSFDAVVGVNNYYAYLVAKARPNIPFWADLNGWLISEGQAQSALIENNSFLPLLWKREKTILTKADKISTVSTPQKYVVYGELASLGRLNSKTNGYAFVEVIPNATEFFASDNLVKPENTNLFRGKAIPENAFIIAFIGGYNTWVDEVTLFTAIENAMKENPEIYFVSTGGAISGLNNKTFQNFKRLIENSSFRQRFHFLGWVETEDIPYVYKESNCGINVDIECIETETGARNRMNEMIKYQLPVITTLGSEISYELKKHRAALTAHSKDCTMLTNHILQLQKNPQLKRDLRSNANQYAEDYASYVSTTKQLISWLESPKCAPKKIINIHRVSKIVASIIYVKQKGIRGVLKKLFQKL